MESKPKPFDIVKGEHSLCFRCEHRALWMETKSRRPRCECGDEKSSRYSCYMYQPVVPLVLEKDKGESRALGIGWALTGRGHAVGLPVVIPHLKTKGKSVLIYNVPSTHKEVGAIKKKGGAYWNKKWKEWKAL